MAGGARLRRPAHGPRPLGAWLPHDHQGRRGGTASRLPARRRADAHHHQAGAERRQGRPHLPAGHHRPGLRRPTAPPQPGKQQLRHLHHAVAVGHRMLGVYSSTGRGAGGVADWCAHSAEPADRLLVAWPQGRSPARALVQACQCLRAGIVVHHASQAKNSPTLDSASTRRVNAASNPRGGAGRGTAPGLVDT